MCRHLAYVGPPVGAAALLLDPPHGLADQVDAPRHQDRGITNRDGWGVAWLEAGSWRLHRSVLPLSEDPAAGAVLGGIEATAVVAAIRRASPGLALVESGNAPFVDGAWVFTLNGFVGGWSSGHAVEPLRAAVSPTRLASLVGDTDSEVLFALTLDRLDTGTAPEDALREVQDLALAAAGGRDSRLNLLLADGASIWATRWSNSLFRRRLEGGGAVVASEPWDDDAGWVEVPERSRLTVGPDAARTIEA
jgi:gamma-glutamyl hercynylcysteine S-oxide hydrolase